MENANDISRIFEINLNKAARPVHDTTVGVSFTPPLFICRLAWPGLLIVVFYT